jgi:hypothetical protein
MLYLCNIIIVLNYVCGQAALLCRHPIFSALGFKGSNLPLEPTQIKVLGTVKKRLRRKGNLFIGRNSSFFAVVGLHRQAVPATQRKKD